MRKISEFARICLAGIIVACLCIPLGVSTAQALEGSLSGVNEHLSPLLEPQHESPIGQLELPGETIFFPWSDQRKRESNHPASGIMPASLPQRDEISMGGSDSHLSVQDLKAMNAVRERDVIYEDYQQGDPAARGLSNSRDIQIVGPGGGAGSGQKDLLGDNIERLVDGALASSMNRGREEKAVSARVQDLGNNLNIEVSGISVSAINTAEGGNAVANSNIIIKPVQVINTPSEVDERIK